MALEYVCRLHHVHAFLERKACRKRLQNELAPIKKEVDAVKSKKYAISLQCMQSATCPNKYKKKDLGYLKPTKCMLRTCLPV